MHDYIRPLQNLADRWNVRGDPVNNACRLAEGRLNLVVVLREPCNLAEDVGYDVMVGGDPKARKGSPEHSGSPTLKEVDYCARWASYKKYGIEHISVFDLNTLFSKRRERSSSTPEEDRMEAHDVFWHMILEKKPDVILILQCDAGYSKNKYVRWLWSSEREAGTMGVININGNETLVIRGFHPSTYLRQDYVSKKQMSEEERQLRMRMIEFCFATAFDALEGKPNPNADLKTKWARYCLQKRPDRSNGFESEETARFKQNQERRINEKLKELKDGVGLADLLSGLTI